MKTEFTAAQLEQVLDTIYQSYDLEKFTDMMTVVLCDIHLHESYVQEKFISMHQNMWCWWKSMGSDETDRAMHYVLNPLSVTTRRPSTYEGDYVVYDEKGNVHPIFAQKYMRKIKD